MKKWLLLLCGLSVVALADLESMTARVPQIVDLKSSGAIGEQADGYLGVVKPNAQAEQLVAAENADRKKVYEERSRAQGQSLDVFCKVMGQARQQKEPSGRWIKSPSGWVQK